MKLLEPITIAGVAFKNRVMFPPLTTGYEAQDGSISSQSSAFYTRLAQGGVGYIVLGDVSPVPSFTPTPKLFHDSQIDSFRQLADNVHAHGAKLGIQIFHPEYDGEALSVLFQRGEMEQVRARLHHDMRFFVDEVTEAALLNIIEAMCACALRAQTAGVDVIQVHGDRLLGALCSSQMNHRTDRFGGSLENRTRFALMLVRALKKAVPNMVIDYKFPVVTVERGKGGIDEADAPQFAQWLQDAGVDMLHVAQANHTGNLADTIPPMGVQPYGFFVNIAGGVKRAISIAVSAVGRIIDPAMAESILQSGKADLVGIGRALLADPDWVNKAAAGHASDIRRCISCNRGCTDNIQNRAFVACVLNAENGFEETRAITPAAVQKTVLGGQLNLAEVPPRKHEMHRAVQNLEQAVVTEGVALRLGEMATTRSVMALAPDAVIVAVGASSFTPDIPGVNGSNVCDAWKVLADKQTVRGRVAVIGGGLVGCETAEHLAAQGCKVAVVEQLDKIGNGLSSTVLPTLLENYKAHGVEQYTGHTVTRIALGELRCEDKDGNTVHIPCDWVVVATGARPVTFDSTALIDKGIEVVTVGDCAEVADISHAIKTGYDAANAIGNKADSKPP